MASVFICFALWCVRGVDVFFFVNSQRPFMGGMSLMKFVKPVHGLSSDTSSIDDRV